MRISAVSPFACLSLLVAGCVPRPPPPAQPVSPTAAIDGVYKGLATGSCGAGEARAVVHDGRIIVSVDPGPRMEGTAQPAGALHATGQGDGDQVNFSGRIDGTELRGGSYNGRCAFAFDLNRA